MSESKETGKVKFFKEKEGYGFITPDAGGKDVFVHANGLTGGLTVLIKDQRVSFTVENHEKGLRAKEVMVM